MIMRLYRLVIIVAMLSSADVTARKKSVFGSKKFFKTPVFKISKLKNTGIKPGYAVTSSPVYRISSIVGKPLTNMRYKIPDMRFKIPDTPMIRLNVPFATNGNVKNIFSWRVPHNKLSYSFPLSPSKHSAVTHSVLNTLGKAPISGKEPATLKEKWPYIQLKSKYNFNGKLEKVHIFKNRPLKQKPKKQKQISRD